MNTPLISIVVPVYNGEETLERCMESILKQDYPRDKYEIIVVDDGSTDGTCMIAEKLADKVIKHPDNLGLARARKSGISASRGELIVNADSDILIKTDTLSKIAAYLVRHEEVSAVTGLLSKEHLSHNFFSQYKNLYMSYIFSGLPERVTFLYGSIYAIRKEVAELYDPGFDIGEDTAFGQTLVSCGKSIVFLRDLEVMHLKKYSLFSFVKNDFLIPFYWAKIFLRSKGWKNLFRNKTGFSHSPKKQLISVVLTPVIFLLGVMFLLGHLPLHFLVVPLLVWLFLNIRFFKFLSKEKRFFFGILAFFVTFLDNAIMAIGILCGFCSFLISDIRWAR